MVNALNEAKLNPRRLLEVTLLVHTSTKDGMHKNQTYAFTNSHDTVNLRNIVRKSKKEWEKEWNLGG